jgi:hypothetical protein
MNADKNYALFYLSAFIRVHRRPKTPSVLAGNQLRTLVRLADKKAILNFGLQFMVITYLTFHAKSGILETWKRQTLSAMQSFGSRTSNIAAIL